MLTQGKRLFQFSVRRTIISWEAIHSICVQCTKSEHLSRWPSVDPDLSARILASVWENLYSKYLVRGLNWVLVYLLERH